MHLLRFALAVLLTCFLFLAGVACSTSKPADTDANGNVTDDDGNSGLSSGAGDISIETSDGFTIAANFVKGNGNEPMPAMLLVHMLGADKSTYNVLQDKLGAKGISSLAIDMRGHGDSTNDGQIRFRDFSVDDWQAAINDLYAGLDYLKGREDVNPNLVGIVGASIGANMAVQVAADEIMANPGTAPKALVLLSPGRNYHEYKPLDRAREIKNIPVFIASSPGDAGSFATSQALSQASKGELHEFEGDAHGTALFDNYPELQDDIANWLSDKIAERIGSVGDGATGIDEPASTSEGASGGQ